MPRLGFGIYQSPTDVCVNSCLTALRAGYRHIDSAQFYRNESEMGEAVRQSGIPRSEVFLTTKILSAGGSPEKTYQKCLDSVKAIDPNEGGYVDLFLIHSPSPGSAKRKEMWQALEKLVEGKKARSIGVSNFGIGHINEMKEYAKIWPPQVNQIEVRPPIISLRMHPKRISQDSEINFLSRIAPPLEPTTRNSRLLPRQQHRHPSLLPPRPQQQSLRREPCRHRQETRQNHRPSTNQILFTERLGAVAEKRYSVPYRGQCGFVWF